MTDLSNNCLGINFHWRKCTYKRIKRTRWNPSYVFGYLFVIMCLGFVLYWVGGITDATGPVNIYYTPTPSLTELSVARPQARSTKKLRIRFTYLYLRLDNFMTQWSRDSDICGGDTSRWCPTKSKHYIIYFSRGSHEKLDLPFTALRRITWPLRISQERRQREKYSCMEKVKIQETERRRKDVLQLAILAQRSSL